MKKENLEKILKGLDLIRESIRLELEDIELLNCNKTIKDNRIDKRKERNFVDNNQNKSTEYLNSLNLKELRAIAKQSNVTIRGSKSDIINRLIEAQNSLEELFDFELEGSKIRKEAVKNRFLELNECMNNGEITKNDIVEFFKEYFDNNKLRLIKSFNMSDENLIKHYCWIQANLIDDKGREVDLQEIYMVDETYYCCGRQMNKIDDITYFCEIDGFEFFQIEGIE